MRSTPYTLSDGTIAYDVEWPGDRERREEERRYAHRFYRDDAGHLRYGSPGRWDGPVAELETPMGEFLAAVCRP